MKQYLKIILLMFFIAVKSTAQITYNFTALAGAFTPNAGATVLHAVGVDDAMSAATNIGFTFQFGCINYTTFQASSNGFLTLGTTAAGSNLGNNLTTNGDRPIVAPLWDDLSVGTGGSVNYVLTGVTPNRVMTIEWLNMNWNYTSGTPVISFQVKLYETSNRVDLVYRQEAGAIVVNGASIGLGGQLSGDFYSLNNTSTAPGVSQALETTSIATKPNTGQVYRWDPILCSGTPTVGSAAATPSVKCANFTTTLTLPGLTPACGVAYQWQSGPTAAGPWTNIAGATTYSATAAVTANTFYRCVLACGVSSVASSVAQASITPSGSCGLCGITSITIPYSATGTTCGAGDDLTSTNATNICGSSLYYGGEDAVFSFTPTSSGMISITYSTSGSSAGIALYQGCPVSGGTCVGYSQGLSSFSGNTNLCLNVTSGQAYYFVIDSWPTPACNPYDFSISAPLTTTTGCSLGSYNAASTPYSFDTFVGTVLPTTDDVLFNSIVNFGFPFCFSGTQYWGGYVASNCAFVFDAVPCYPNISTSTYAAGGVGTGYTIGSAAPVNGTSIPRNAVLAPWHDSNPSLGGTMRYATLGVAPNRRFVASWESIPMYSCGTSSPAIYYTGQVKLYETSNNIEIHVGNKGICPGWNGGYAVMGLHNFDGTIYRPPVNATAHNYPTQWVMTNTAYRYTAPCAVSGGPCITLPNNFKSFYGQQIETVNKLSWETAVEENISEFIVERSTDAINFTEVGRTLPNNKPSKYDFNDITYKPSIINYYRITLLGVTGRISTYILPIGDDIEDVNVSEIYPNPVKDNFTLTYNSKIETQTEVIIKDMYGRIVKTSHHSINAGNTRTIINCSELTTGVYIAEVKDSVNGKVISQQKLIVLN